MLYPLFRECTCLCIWKHSIAWARSLSHFKMPYLLYRDCTFYSLSNCHEWTLLPIFSSMLPYEYFLLSHELWTANNSFWLYIPKKTPKYQLSICKQNYITLSGVELYNTRCSHSAVSFAIYFQKELWNCSSNLVEDICIYFRIRTTKMVPWICYFFFLNIYLGFMSEVWLISFGII